MVVSTLVATSYWADLGDKHGVQESPRADALSLGTLAREGSATLAAPKNVILRLGPPRKLGRYSLAKYVGGIAK
jgi:hypothetical protein